MVALLMPEEQVYRVKNKTGGSIEYADELPQERYGPGNEAVHGFFSNTRMERA